MAAIPMPPRLLPWLVASLLVLALFLFAWTGYPPPGSDAPGFLVSAINLARGHGFVNQLYPQAALADPSGGRRHIYNAPLFPLVLAGLMPFPTPQGAFLVVAALHGASLLLCVLFFSRLLGAYGAGWTWANAGLASAALCGLATHWMPTVGRPEALETLMVLLAALAPFHLSGVGLRLAWGTLAGAVAAMHPIGAVQLVAAIGMYLAVRQDTRRWLRDLLTVASLAVVVFAGLLAVTPHGLRASLEGMARAFPYTPWLVVPSVDGWKMWITARRSTFYGPLLALCVACGARLLARRGPMGSRPGFAASLALLLACFYLGSLTFRSLRNYNILSLGPLFFGVVVAWHCDSALRAATPRRRAAQVLAFVLTLATGTGFLGRLAALPLFARDYCTLARAREAWRHVDLPRHARIAVMGNAWALGEDYERMEPASYGDERRLAARGLVLLRSQRGGERAPAPQLPGFRKAADHFDAAAATRQPGVLRVLEAFLEEDYAFVVYVPEAHGP